MPQKHGRPQTKACLTENSVPSTDYQDKLGDYPVTPTNDPTNDPAYEPTDQPTDNSANNPTNTNSEDGLATLEAPQVSMQAETNITSCTTWSHSVSPTQKVTALLKYM